MTISPFTSRMLALGLVFLLGLLVWSCFFAPVLASLSADRHSMAALRLQEQHSRLTGAALPTMRQELDNLQKSHALDSVFLEGDNATLLAAELQRRSSGIISVSGATLLSSLTTPVESEAGHVRIGLQLEVTATIGALQAMLYQMETSKPLLTIDHLGIEAPENGQPQGRQEEPPVFLVHLHITAYARSAT